ncbi:MAG: uroporphyrinogen decarboxylase family protein [Candidatus Kariarchaeaceae archaeon]|jgi:uroporphyrinogen decarboxylase
MEFDNTLSVIRGKVTSQALISIWRHYPEIDLQINRLVEATIADYKKYPSDLIKLSPHGRYCVIDFGCEIIPGTTKYGTNGSSSCKKCVVNVPEDWEKIVEFDPLDGHHGLQLEYIKQIREAFPETPIMMTVFTPTMVARKLSKNKMPDHYFQEPNASRVKEALNIIDKITQEFARASIDAGADGIFSAIQEADRSVANNEEQIITLVSLNKPFMNSISNKANFTVLHLHGADLMFKEAVDILNPTAVNWHDQTTEPDLLTASKTFQGGILGGLEPQDVLEGKIDEAISTALELKDQIPLILAPGCVLLQGTEEEILADIFKKYKK